MLKGGVYHYVYDPDYDTFNIGYNITVPDLQQIIDVKLASQKTLHNISLKRPSFIAYLVDTNRLHILPKFKLLCHMQHFATNRNNEWIANWNNDTQSKYGVLIYNGQLYTTKRRVNNDFVFGIAVESEILAEEMLEKFKNRIKKYY